ncbi:SGNH/GDSL hydrolase family protein [Planctomicrobium sp.]|nr:SGNH/GDSL hydrolase family protein [Planctomicrobium sp.]
MNGSRIILNSKVKHFCFRLFAVLIGLFPFVLLEFGLSLAEVGQSASKGDPFVEFLNSQPLFVLDKERKQMTIASFRREFFVHDEFPVEKKPGTYRIFCLGGSTVQGRPYSIQTSFPTWLKLGLEAAEPNINWEVINCGGVSYASYRLLPIMQECLKYEPDLFIICTGHNEFLEDRSYTQVKGIPDWSKTTINQLSKLRTVSAATSFFKDQQQNKLILPTDADAILNYKNGLAAYHRDPEWNEAIAEHFNSIIRRMMSLCQKADVPLLMMLPPSNLSGTVPFKSETENTTQFDEQVVQELKDEARSHYRTDLKQSVVLWKHVCLIDEFTASNHFELGKCLEILNRFEEARAAYLKARDLDVCPLRMTSSLEKVLLSVTQETQTPIINLHQIFQDKSDHLILGDRWLVDHVHPNFEGHQQIAFTIGRWLEEERVVELSQDWEAECQLIFKTHFESLDRTYFHKGQRALQGLKLWTQGNADGPPVEKKFPHLLRN